MKIEDLKEELKELLDFLNQNSLKKISVKKGDLEIILEKEDRHTTQSQDVRVVESKPLITETKSFFVTSPMVGTFYASPAPDHPQFVKVGDAIEENSVVCIIEAMKVMNEVKAGKKGIVAEVLVENGQPIEFGTKLFRIE